METIAQVVLYLLFAFSTSFKMIVVFAIMFVVLSPLIALFVIPGEIRLWYTMRKLRREGITTRGRE